MCATGVKLLGLMTRPGVRSDEIERWLAESYSFRPYRLDEPIQRATLALCDLGALDETVPGLSLTPSQIAARMAHFVRQNLSSRLLLQLADQKLRPVAFGARIVVTGLTQESEAAWLRERGGRIVHVMPTSGAVSVSAHGERDVAIRVGKADLSMEFQRVAELLGLEPLLLRDYEDCDS